MSGPGASNPLLEAALNLARFHKEHERFYASSPLESAVRLQRHARALLALADRWSTVEQPARRSAVWQPRLGFDPPPGCSSRPAATPPSPTARAVNRSCARCVGSSTIVGNGSAESTACI